MICMWFYFIVFEHVLHLYIVSLFDLILHVTVNNFSAISGQVFLGRTSPKHRLMCLARGHNTVVPVRIKPTTPQPLDTVGDSISLEFLLALLPFMSLVQD